MAIGLARMMGFVFPENFNNPYISQSITEFWRRWHISLSRWMRDYLYIPLGGNRVSVSRMYFNLCLVFIISGFWHGAEWTFLFWGAYHGLLLVAERLFLNNILDKLAKPVRILYSFIAVVVGWVFFRAESIGQAFGILKKMFVFNYGSFFITVDNKVMFMLVVAFVCCFMASFKSIEAAEERAYVFSNTKPAIFTYVLAGLAMVILSLGYIASNGFNPFIYYRF
jgi:alginate O-acetyltransferase complex protein AlgI